MNPVISNMNDILLDWKIAHDLLSGVSGQFQERQGVLCFDSRPLVSVEKDLHLLYAESDSESIQYFLNESRSITLTIAWPEDKPPVVASVSISYLFAQPEHIFQTENQ